MNFENWCTYI